MTGIIILSITFKDELIKKWKINNLNNELQEYEDNLKSLVKILHKLEDKNTTLDRKIQWEKSRLEILWNDDKRTYNFPGIAGDHYREIEDLKIQVERNYDKIKENRAEQERIRIRREGFKENIDKKKEVILQ